MSFFLQSTVVCDDCGHVPYQIPEDRPRRQYRSSIYCCINKSCRSFKAQFRITFPLAQDAVVVRPVALAA